MNKKKRTSKSYTRKTKKNKNSGSSGAVRSFLKLIGLIVIVGLIIYYFFLRTPDTGLNLTPSKPVRTTEVKPSEPEVDVSELSEAERIRYALLQLLTEYGFRDSWIDQNNQLTKAVMPQDFPNIVFVRDVINRMDEWDFDIISSTENLTTQQSKIEIGRKKEVLHTLVLQHDISLKKVRGKIAIVIDDFGYSDNEDIQSILSAPFPVTIAILPGLPKSKALYQMVSDAGKEKIIHLPMEALDDKVEYTDYSLYANMTKDEIRHRVRKALMDFPDAKGINNHMGSRITQNKELMKIVFEELRQKNSYFVDSKTTSKSIAFKTAREMNLPSLENNLFLERDRNDDEEYLRKKLIALSKIAEKQGYAVAIGHPYKNTINVLLKVVPEMQKDGYVFVSVSELINSAD